MKGLQCYKHTIVLSTGACVGGSVEGVCQFLITTNGSDALSQYPNKVHSATQHPQVSSITLLIHKFL